jgi:hypothetical protein
VKIVWWYHTAICAEMILYIPRAGSPSLTAAVQLLFILSKTLQLRNQHSAFRMRQILHLALTLLFASNAFSQAVFRRPPGSGPSQNYLDNPTYVLGDELQIIWEMDYNITTLVMWNQDAYGNFPQPISADILGEQGKPFIEDWHF